jgi:mRNA-degrading endonuclease RelE of RelBE toxin-antitoxin system
VRSILITPAADRQLRKLRPALQTRAARVLRGLAADDPTLHRRKLADRPETRIRDGDLRIFYVVDADGTLLVTRIADRKDAY